jgi:hypothetical protein
VTRCAATSVLLAGAIAFGAAARPVPSEYREPYTGEQLVALCSDPGEAARCAGYVDGVRAGMHAQREYLGRQLDKAKQAAPAPIAPLLMREPFCVDAAVDTDMLVGVVVSFIRANPDRHKDPATSAIVLALQNAFPCGG